MKTGDLLLMSGTNNFEFFLKSKYTHCGLIIIDDNKNIFILESSYGFNNDNMKLKYKECVINGITIPTSLKDGFRLIPFDNIIDYYELHREEYPDVEYYYFKQKKQINTTILIFEILEITKSNYTYPTKYINFLPCICSYWPKMNSDYEIFCSEAIAYILKKVKFTHKNVFLKKSYQYKPYDIITTLHFPYYQHCNKINVN
jgi:hypothetical protein